MQRIIQLLPQIVQLANIAVMIVLIIFIAVQNKSSGLSSVFGGTGTIASTRRGVEKWLFYSTIILAFLFVGLSITLLFLKR